MKPYLRNLTDGATSANNLFKRNLLKEYLQIAVLDFIYSHPEYSRLVFYGGSCLAQCYGLPRLSEDLDFVDTEKKIKVGALAADLEKFFRNTDLKMKATEQKFRIYLKFFLLKELGLSVGNETDQLFVKVEIFSGFDFCRKYQTEIKPLFKHNRTVLANVFDLPTLMATKIRAVLGRKWEKTDKSGRVIMRVKGRDYFDLMWYLEKGVKPNLACIESAAGMEELKADLLKNVEKLDERSVRLDLEAFIDDEEYVKRLSKNLKKILAAQIEKM